MAKARASKPPPRWKGRLGERATQSQANRLEIDTLLIYRNPTKWQLLQDRDTAPLASGDRELKSLRDLHWDIAGSLRKGAARGSPTDRGPIPRIFHWQSKLILQTSFTGPWRCRAFQHNLEDNQELFTAEDAEVCVVEVGHDILWVPQLGAQKS